MRAARSERRPSRPRRRAPAPGGRRSVICTAVTSGVCVAVYTSCQTRAKRARAAAALRRTTPSDPPWPFPPPTWTRRSAVPGGTSLTSPSRRSAADGPASSARSADAIRVAGPPERAGRWTSTSVPVSAASRVPDEKHFQRRLGATARCGRSGRAQKPRRDQPPDDHHRQDQQPPRAARPCASGAPPRRRAAAPSGHYPPSSSARNSSSVSTVTPSFRARSSLLPGAAPATR